MCHPFRLRTRVTALSNRCRAADGSLMPGCREIQSDPADTRLAHRVKLRIGRLVVNHRHAARAAAQLAHAVERARVVGAVHARLHDDDAIADEAPTAASRARRPRRSLACSARPSKNGYFFGSPNTCTWQSHASGGHVEVHFRQAAAARQPTPLDPMHQAGTPAAIHLEHLRL